ncbi:hypothetical protein C5F64_15625 [Photobacterium damselae subsp. damselae]|uniref:hypothetical protein n=1 Tax=Photobacterium damselae TaxID=38293 RepID=UPI000D07D79B|nr:hypothetical protein [Photobacterium damselae]PSB82676.1 hypothetical protein C5F64_15625 [Photobacterium damselae subsp. damselae]
MIKPSVLIVFVLCLSGYLYLKTNPKTSVTLSRTSGYHTFFWSASWGVGMGVRAVVIYYIGILLHDCFGWSFSLGNLFLNTILKCDLSYTGIAIFDLSVVTIILGYLLPASSFKFNKKTQKERQIGWLREDTESPEFTKLFFKSFEYGLPILFTMSDRKVYIGYVLEIHATNFNDVNIIPIFSGYRDKDTLSLVPVTPYKDVIGEVEDETQEKIDIEVFSVTLPLREINHAHLHDFRYYSKFKSLEEKSDSLFNTYNYSNNSINY